MADPISTISLAACAVQFVDYGLKFISATVKIYQSVTGGLDEQNELCKIVEALQLQSDSINRQASPNDPAMAGILKSCVAVSFELRDVLSSITRSMSSTSSKSITNSAITSFRAMMRSSKIKELEARFVRLREQLCFNLLATMYEHRSCTESALTELLGAQKAFHHSSFSRLERIIRTLEDLKNASPPAMLSLPQQGVESLPQELPGDSFSRFADMFAAFSRERKETRIRSIIKSLEFPQISDRETTILDAHKTTFEWAFSQEKSNLAEWLSSGSGIYWISGKAGSGKSTLLKFLRDHGRTEKLLNEWSGGKTLVTASHFFWALGSPLQKSHQGLLQTLVYRILQKHPEQVSIVSPTRWTSWTDIQPSWSLSELSECLQSLASINDLRVCLFIDGLDEYQGDHQDLVETLQAFTSSEHIKICASSRPWVEFASAFGSGHWKLQVQDLTRQDISSYASDKLKSHKDIGSYGSKVDIIAQEIRLRAQGVFLWVYLVVRSLIRGMRYMDTIEDLWERLNALPTDLEEYFKRMLDSIEPIYRKRTARALRAISKSDSGVGVPLITFYFMDLEVKDPEYAFDSLKSPTPGQESEFYNRLEHEKRHQIVAQCRDLVHVSEIPIRTNRVPDPPWSMAASFLHRTVADFLMTSEVHDMLVSRSGDDFDPRVSICRSHLAQLKIMSHIDKTRLQSDSSRRNSWIFQRHSLLISICANACDIEKAQGRMERRILDSSAPYHTGLKSQDSSEISPQPCPEFLDVAIRLGLSIYAKEILNDHKDLRRGGLISALREPLLIGEGRSLFVVCSYDQLDLGMARYLLDLDVSPNELAYTDGQVTIWSQVLRQCLDSTKHPLGLGGCTMDTAFSILHLLLSYGAMPISLEWNRLENEFSKDRFSELKFAWENATKKAADGESQWNYRSDIRAKVTGKVSEAESESDNEAYQYDRRERGVHEANSKDVVQVGSEGGQGTGQVEIGKSQVQVEEYHTPGVIGQAQEVTESCLPSKSVGMKRRRGMWKWLRRKM